MAHLVHLVQHEDGVVALGPAQALDDAARHRADVGAAEATDFRLIADAAQRQPDELAAHRARNGAAQRGLAGARRPDEAEDHALALAADQIFLLHDAGFTVAAVFHPAFHPQLAHGQKLQDAFLDLLQAVVILIQHQAGVRDVEVVVGGHFPRQADHPVQVGLDDGILGGLRGHLAHAIELAARFLLGLLGHAGRRDAALELLDLGLLLVRLAQLLLDGLELLAQEILALHLGHLILGLRLDLLAELQDFQFLRQQRIEPDQLLFDLVDLQDFLGLGGFHADARRHQIGQLARARRVDRGGLQLLGHVRHQAHQPAEELLRGAHQRLLLQRRRFIVRHHRDVGPQIGVLLEDAVDPNALQALHDQADGAVGRAQHAMHQRRGAHLKDLIGSRFFHFGIARGEQPDDPMAVFVRQRIIDQADRPLLADGQGQPHHGIHDHPTQRQDGQFVRDREFLLFVICHL